MLLPLYSSHVNKQLSEAFTPRTCLSSRLFFPKLFKQVYRLNSVQTLKKKQPIGSCMTLMLDLLHPQSPGGHLPLLCVTHLPTWALQLRGSILSRPVAWHFHCQVPKPPSNTFPKPPPTIGTPIPLFWKRCDISGVLEHMRKSRRSFLHWSIDSSVLVFPWALFQKGPTITGTD